MQGSRIDAVGLDDIVSWALKYAQKSEQSSTLAVTLGGYIKKIGPSVLCIDACRFESNISFYWCSLFGRAVSGTMPKSQRSRQKLNWLMPQADRRFRGSDQGADNQALGRSNSLGLAKEVSFLEATKRPIVPAPF